MRYVSLVSVLPAVERRGSKQHQQKDHTTPYLPYFHFIKLIYLSTVKNVNRWTQTNVSTLLGVAEHVDVLVGEAPVLLKQKS